MANNNICIWILIIAIAVIVVWWVMQPSVSKPYMGCCQLISTPSGPFPNLAVYKWISYQECKDKDSESVSATWRPDISRKLCGQLPKEEDENSD